MNRVHCNSQGVAQAAQIISEGGTAVFPTDTVYGIGCDPYNRDAVRRIYSIKHRNTSKALPVLAYSTDMIWQIAEESHTAHTLATKFWPGALTMILDVKDSLLEESLNLDGRIALRVPAGRCIRALLRKCGMVVGTSANQSGAPSPVNPDCISVSCDIMLDGGTISGGQESTIVSVTRERMTIVREGAISRETLGA